MGTDARDYGPRNNCECGWLVHLPACPTGEREARLADKARVIEVFRRLAVRAEDWVDPLIDSIMGAGWSERERDAL